jgi:prepilin signal peptidase PulO-like enzyme (type II secretory pathway)
MIIWLPLLLWLGICVAHDLRSRQVPTILTVPPLLLAGIWRIIQGDWEIVLLVLALILISDIPNSAWRIPLACLGTILTLSLVDQPEQMYAALVCFAVWALWEIGATGGADAKLIITLLLFFADGLLFIPIVLVGGLQGLIGLIARRKTIPYTVSIAAGATVWLLFLR